MVPRAQADRKPSRTKMMAVMIFQALVVLCPQAPAGPITGPSDIRMDLESLPSVHAVDAVEIFTAALERSGPGSSRRAALELALDMVMILRLNRLDASYESAGDMFAYTATGSTGSRCFRPDK
ncbi:MAG: hypothetical protein D6806_00070 [Deltaproteobacteria bacterium]|nr:MAG: hypothetical protein D6806_00070 [Deltaproteobacteria bacterium]